MSENNEALMQKYGIKVEEANTYIYKGSRYRNLDDAVNYAILKEEKPKVVSADNSQVPKRGHSNAVAE